MHTARDGEERTLPMPVSSWLLTCPEEWAAGIINARAVRGLHTQRRRRLPNFIFATLVNFTGGRIDYPRRSRNNAKNHKMSSFGGHTLPTYSSDGTAGHYHAASSPRERRVYRKRCQKCKDAESVTLVSVTRILLWVRR